MENNIARIEGILLTGKEATIIPCLAIVGAASIISGVGYVSYKLGEKRREKKSLKRSIKDFVEKTDE